MAARRLASTIVAALAGALGAPAPVLGAQCSGRPPCTSAYLELVSSDGSTVNTYRYLSGGDGFTTPVSESQSVPDAAAFAAADPTGPLLRASAVSAQSGDSGGSAAGDAEMLTDDILVTTPANSLGQSFAVAISFSLDGTLSASGGGTATGSLSVSFDDAFDFPDESAQRFSQAFSTDQTGSGAVNLTVSNFTNYGARPLQVPGAAASQTFAFRLDIQLAAAATGNAEADFGHTFTAHLVYDPALVVSAPFGVSAVPEPANAALLAAGLGLLAAARRRWRARRAAQAFL